MEVSREDLLKESECDVDSTTEDSPVKKPKPAHAKKSDMKSQKKPRLWLLNREQRDICNFKLPYFK